jgi:hypothetical protein
MYEIGKFMKSEKYKDIADKLSSDRQRLQIFNTDRGIFIRIGDYVYLTLLLERYKVYFLMICFSIINCIKYNTLICISTVVVQIMIILYWTLWGDYFHKRLDKEIKRED